MPKLTDAQAAELANLRDRCLYILHVFEQAEPTPFLARLRELVLTAASNHSIRDLRTIVTELRGMSAALSPPDRRTLDAELRERFGTGPGEERQAVAVARIRARGAIRSEREYRLVESYTDQLAGNPDSQDEFLALGALLQ